MKPDSTAVAQQLIDRLREQFPFSLPESQICDGECRGCSLKVLGFLEGELDALEARINNGELLGLADLSRLASTARKVSRVLRRSGLPTPDEAAFH